MFARIVAVAVAVLIGSAQAIASPITNVALAGTELDGYSNVLGGSQVLEAHGHDLSGGRASAALATNDAHGVKVATGSASLATGDLKAVDRLGNIPASDYEAHAASFVAFGDSFTTRVGQQPFVWGDRTATFSITFDGIVGEALGHLQPAQVRQLATVKVFILRPGTFPDFGNSVPDTYRDLLGPRDQVNVPQYPDVLADFAYGLTSDTTSVEDIQYGGERALDGTFVATADPQTFDVTFAPHGDFQWVIDLESIASIFAGGDALAASSLDFGSTVHVAYQGPAGTTTYSGSGVFPGTLSSDHAVPEPEAWALLAFGIALCARRRSRSDRATMPLPR